MYSYMRMIAMFIEREGHNPYSCNYIFTIIVFGLISLRIWATVSHFRWLFSANVGHHQSTKIVINKIVLNFREFAVRETPMTFLSTCHNVSKCRYLYFLSMGPVSKGVNVSLRI